MNSKLFQRWASNTHYADKVGVRRLLSLCVLPSTKMLIELLVFAASVCLCLYYWQRYLHSYWRRHNVVYLQPTTLFGNLRDMFTFKTGFLGQMWALHQDKELSPSAPLVGIYTLYRPALLIRDVDLIKRIMIKDFNSFSNRVLSADPHHDPLGHYNLFFIRNPEWRELRAKLSPTFSSGKVKQMYPLMVEIGQELETVLDALPKDAAIDMKDICGRFTNELIGSTAFGIRAGSLRDANSQFYQHSRAIFAITARRGFEFFCLLFVPVLTRLLRIKLFTKKTSNFLRSSVQHVMAERERTGATRNDFIDTLLALKREAYAQPEQQHPAKNPDFLVAQAALFHTAGYESSSSTLMFALYELALQPRLQERLRAEISVAFGADDSVAYDKLHELPYLDQVVDETLRKYPVVGFMERECTADYSLAPYSDFTVPAGTAIYVSLLGIHRDERYWPEPDKFDPERFAPENRKNLNMNAYMPFGIGPHNCIGMRLGLLQTKLGLLHALRNHRVVAFDETPQQVQFDPYTFVLSNKGGVHLKVERVDN